MRSIALTALGGAFVAAGLAVPCGETMVAADGAEPAGPGRRTEVVVPGCVGGASYYAESHAFAGRVSLDRDGTGSAWIRRDARPGRYTVSARCGDRWLHDVIEVRTERAWRSLLPAPLAS